jgi:bacteriocin biosynthesis cyclodehydratase domain-containing protein
MPEDLPQRPRVRPGLAVLRRQTGEIQIGLDPRHATVISGLPEPVVTAAGQLTGHRTAADLLDEVGDPAGRSALRDLLSGLAARGLVQDAGETAVPARLRGEETARARPERDTWHPAARGEAAVAVYGDGRLAVSLACLLAAAGVGWVHVAAGGAVLPEDVGTGYLADDVGRPRGEAARDAVLRVGGPVRTGAFDSRRRPDLVLLADAVVPEPGLVNLLVADAVPHLAVHVRDGVGVVGPLVVPGVTSCLRCADLRRSQVDQCWPRVAAQLAGRAQLADLACTQATTGFAAAQALEALHWSRSAHGRPMTWNASVEIDPIAARIHYRRWPSHPACPCRGLRRACG